jgi:hypothetical protein
VSKDTTLQEFFPELRKRFPKGAHIQWAACQDLPAVDRKFQIKVMNVSDRYAGPVKRTTTSGGARKAEIKLIAQMIKDFKSL